LNFTFLKFNVLRILHYFIMIFKKLKIFIFKNKPNVI